MGPVLALTVALVGASLGATFPRRRLKTMIVTLEMVIVTNVTQNIRDFHLWV